MIYDLITFWVPLVNLLILALAVPLLRVRVSWRPLSISWGVAKWVQRCSS